MTKSYITQLVFDIMSLAIEVHRHLGPGLLESVYHKCLKHELVLNGFKVNSNMNVPVYYKGLELNTDFRLDLMVNQLVIIEIKSVEHILPVHSAQVLTYMKLLNKPKGILINFNSDQLIKGTKHLVNEIFRHLPD
ncbi:MAG: GxxExxY protein [Saprospiraceae bacterium]|nr:GxxExxY protein [Saprospiraceae bacterium]